MSKGLFDKEFFVKSLIEFWWQFKSDIFAGGCGWSNTYSSSWLLMLKKDCVWLYFMLKATQWIELIYKWTFFHANKKEILLWNITFWLKVNLLKMYFHLEQKQIVDWIAIKILLFLLNNKLNYAKPYKSQVARAKNATNIAIQQRTKIKAYTKKLVKKDGAWMI